MNIKTPKKLIEVALPLDDINAAAAREKSIRHGHPSTLHLWWARRPLAAARAVLFAQLVNDPGYQRELGRGVNRKDAEIKREALFQIIRDLVKWENTNNEAVLNRARAAIRESWRETCHLNRNHPQAAELFDPEKLPAFHDPFAGGGAIPLEAQRLGLESYASDLNPVAVLINKAMIEIPPRFAGRPPVNPQSRADKDLVGREWHGAQGLAEDVRYYGKWLRDQAEKRIGHLYPKVKVSAEMVAERPDLKSYRGRELTVIAWLWARTVKSPNPAFANVEVPLASTFMLSTKPGKEAYVEPVIEKGRYRFTVKVGKPKDPAAAKAGTKLGRGANFQCLMSGTPMTQEHIRGEFKAKRASERLMAIVAEGDRGRLYLPSSTEQETIARQAKPAWKPEVEMNQDSKDLLSGRGYGFKYWHELFTPRQLVALTTFSDLVSEAMARIREDASQAWPASSSPLSPLSPLPASPRWGEEHGCIGQDSVAPSPQQGSTTPSPQRGEEHGCIGQDSVAPSPQQGSTTPSPQRGEEHGCIEQDSVAPSPQQGSTTPSPQRGEEHGCIGQDSVAPSPQQGSTTPSPQRGEGWGGGKEGKEEQKTKPWHPKPIPKNLLTHARNLRKHMTNAEQRLWCCLRGKQIDGFKFRKQHPVGRYVLDFYCPARKLAIELDGGQHNTPEGRDKDERRSEWLKQQQITVIRFWNNEVVENLEGVLTRIWAVLQGVASSPPLPSTGEGRETGGCVDPDVPLRDGGAGAEAYAEAVGVYLGFALDKVADRGSSLGRWDPTPTQSGIINTFSRQALPMTWDFGESNPLGDASGNYVSAIDLVSKALLAASPVATAGSARQDDASVQVCSTNKLVSTDPPYYDNIGYADLSDFFYVWLRRSLRPVFPDLFATLAVPKAEELVATPYRHGDREKAETFFLNGMTQTMQRLAEQAHPGFPVTIYYAFKQSEKKGDGGTASTGWETFLEAVIQAGFGVNGTWPMRTELANRMIGSGTNALASSIVLVCRKRPNSTPPSQPPPAGGRGSSTPSRGAPLPLPSKGRLAGAGSPPPAGGRGSSTPSRGAPFPLPSKGRLAGAGSPPPSGGRLGGGSTTRRDFQRQLREEMPAALETMIGGETGQTPIAPVDLAQAAIGPGMAIFSQYDAVLNQDGSRMTVRDALVLINRAISDYLNPESGNFDADTQFCSSWFDQYGWSTGPFGEADTLSRAKGTSVDGVREAGVLESGGGKVRLLKWSEYEADWDPAKDNRTPIWEACHQMIRHLKHQGESAAGELLARMPEKGESIRQLAYHLYTLCERKKWAEDARAYNELIGSWHAIVAASHEVDYRGAQTEIKLNF